MSGSHNTHAKISPSGLDRSTVCTASTAFIDELIEDGRIPKYSPMNKFGASGTFAHDLAEEALLHLLGEKESEEIKAAKSLHHWLESKDFYWTDAMTGRKELFQKGYGELENYIDYCMAQVKHDQDIVYVEVRSKLFYSDVPTDKGTCDFLILHYDGSITIVDLKWRRSGMVESVKNKQLSAYGMSYIQNKMVRQPKMSNVIRLATYNPLVAPYVRPWNTTYMDLKQFCEDEIQEPVDVITEGKMTMFVPTVKACLWCPAKEVCRARLAKVAIGFPKSFNADLVEPEELVEFLKIEPENAAFFKDANSILLNRADIGKAVPGTRLVEGRSNRRYDNVELAGDFLTQHLDHDDVFDPPKIKSFSKITPKLEPDIKKKFETEFLVKPKGKMKLALDDDTEAMSVTSLKAKLLKSKKK